MSMIDGGIARSNDDGTKAMDIDSQHSPEMATRAQDLLHAFQHVTSRVAAAKSPSRNVRYAHDFLLSNHVIHSISLHKSDEPILT